MILSHPGKALSLLSHSGWSNYDPETQCWWTHDIHDRWYYIYIYSHDTAKHLLLPSVAMVCFQFENCAVWCFCVPVRPRLPRMLTIGVSWLTILGESWRSSLNGCQGYPQTGYGSVWKWGIPPYIANFMGKMMIDHWILGHPSFRQLLCSRSLHVLGVLWSQMIDMPFNCRSHWIQRPWSDPDLCPITCWAGFLTSGSIPVLHMDRMALLEDPGRKQMLNIFWNLSSCNQNSEIGCVLPQMQTSLGRSQDCQHRKSGWIQRLAIGESPTYGQRFALILDCVP